eukprot:Rmarinus@m.28321
MPEQTVLSGSQPSSRGAGMLRKPYRVPLRMMATWCARFTTPGNTKRPSWSWTLKTYVPGLSLAFVCPTTFHMGFTERLHRAYGSENVLARHSTTVSVTLSPIVVVGPSSPIFRMHY